MDFHHHAGQEHALSKLADKKVEHWLSFTYAISMPNLSEVHQNAFYIMGNALVKSERWMPVAEEQS